MAESGRFMIIVLVMAAVTLPLPLILGALTRTRRIADGSGFHVAAGVVHVAVAILACVAVFNVYFAVNPNYAGVKGWLGICLKDVFIYQGAMINFLACGLGMLLAAGKLNILKDVAGTSAYGYSAGILTAQTMSIFHQCNVNGVFQ